VTNQQIDDAAFSCRAALKRHFFGEGRKLSSGLKVFRKKSDKWRDTCKALTPFIIGPLRSRFDLSQFIFHRNLWRFLNFHHKKPKLLRSNPLHPPEGYNTKEA
jgi:hypothetical protein